MSYQYPYYNPQPPQSQYIPPQQSLPSRSSWHDPRLASVARPQAYPQAYPQQATGPEGVAYAQSVSYNPNTYGPISGVNTSPVSPIQPPQPLPHHDTSKWGVRYNSGLQQEEGSERRPPLPPRPTTGPTSPEQQSEGEQYVWQDSQSLVYDAATSGAERPVAPPSTYEQLHPPPLPYRSVSDVGQHDYGQQAQSPQWQDYNQGYQSPNQALQTQQPTCIRYSSSGPPPLPPKPPPGHYEQAHIEQWAHAQHRQDMYGGGFDYGAAQPSSGPYGNLGPQQSHSPPPIADYNIQKPWSDPVIPLPMPEPSVDALQQRISSSKAETGQSAGVSARDTDRRQESQEDADNPFDDKEAVSPWLKEVSLADKYGQSSRDGTVSPEMEFVPDRTGTIDGVIEAWTKPIQPKQTIMQSTPWNDPGFPPVMRQPTLPPDPRDQYRDLLPESFASLNRFVAMLRREAAAELDGEKFQIFKTFMDKETRLRGVLYGIDLHETEVGKSHTETLSENEAHEGNQQIKSAVQPPAPILQRPTMTSSPEPFEETAASGKDAQGASSEPVQVDQSVKPQDEIATPDKDGAFGPGGIPIMKRSPNTGPTEATSIAPRRDPQVQTHSPQPSPAGLNNNLAQRPRSSGEDAPIAVEAGEYSESMPFDSHTQTLDTTPSNVVPPRRQAYTPFRYRESPRGTSQVPLVVTPSTQSYTVLRQAFVDSGRAMAPSAIEESNRDGTGTPSSGRQEHAEAFLGLLRQRSQNSHKSPRPMVAELPIESAADKALRALRNVVPSTIPTYTESTSLSSLKDSLQSIPDEFGFIHHTVLQWNRGNLETRKRLDIEKRKRAEESERNIDALFEDNQIAYADIPALDAEFRASEAKTAADEDMQEAQSFTIIVYRSVTARLQNEINSLATLYARSMTLLESQSCSGAQFVRKSADHTALPQAMDIALVIFSKMQIRHQKLLEASLEHHRRMRKARVSALRSTGTITETQDYEISSLKEEQELIIDAKEKDDERANFLMDTFDKVVVKGLAENQSFVDELLPPLHSVAAATTSSSSSTTTNLKTNDVDDSLLRSTLLSALACLNFLTADSTSILRFSCTCDTILNNADYDVSVAKAYRNDAGPEEFVSLEVEKLNEDEKIKRETEAKIVSMGEGSSECLGLVGKCLEGLEGGVGHKERVEGALVRAKMRNESLGSAVAAVM